MKTPAIGIDLGTSFCRVGVWQKDRVEILENDRGRREIPNYVSFTDTERLIGEDAKSQAYRKPKDTIFNAKRLIGRPFYDPGILADTKYWPFTVVDVGGRPRIQAEYKHETKQFSPEEITSMLLRKMKDTAEAHLGCQIQSAVISVPAHFTYTQRQATRDAGKIAGLNVLGILNEPSAAALAHGCFNNLVNRNVLIFDLGGGTFDVSVFCFEKSVFKVMATAGDTRLGGEDFDHLLVNHLIDEFKAKHKKDISTSQKSLLRLKTAAKKAKHCLSFSFKASVEIDALFEGIDFYTKISRATFETLCSGLFNKMITYVEKALADANLDKSLVHEVVLVGGSTIIPKVKSLLQNFFGKSMSFLINPEEAVVTGAAIQAAILNLDRSPRIDERLLHLGRSPRIDEMLLLEVTSYSLGVETADGLMTLFLARNTTIPTSQTQTLKSNVTLQVYEGEHTKVKDNILLGSCKLTGIPPGAKMCVTFDVDHDGILTVKVDKLFTKKKTVIIKSVCNLTDEELERMFDAAQRFNKDANEQLARAEARNSLESYILRMEEALKIAGPKIAEIRLWLNSSTQADHKVYNEKLEEIRKVCCPIVRAYNEADSSLGVDRGFSGETIGQGADSVAGCSGSSTNGPTIKEEPVAETPMNRRKRAFEEREPPVPTKMRF